MAASFASQLSPWLRNRRNEWRFLKSWSHSLLKIRFVCCPTRRRGLMDACNLRPFSLITASLVNTLICHIHITQSAKLSSKYVDASVHFFFDFLCTAFAIFVILSLCFIILRIVASEGVVAEDISIRAHSATYQKCSVNPSSFLLFHSSRTRYFCSHVNLVLAPVIVCLKCWMGSLRRPRNPGTEAHIAHGRHLRWMQRCSDRQSALVDLGEIVHDSWSAGCVRFSTDCHEFFWWQVLLYMLYYGCTSEEQECKSRYSVSVQKVSHAHYNKSRFTFEKHFAAENALQDCRNLTVGFIRTIFLPGTCTWLSSWLNPSFLLRLYNLLGQFGPIIHIFWWLLCHQCFCLPHIVWILGLHHPLCHSCITDLLCSASCHFAHYCRQTYIFYDSKLLGFEVFFPSNRFSAVFRFFPRPYA